MVYDCALLSGCAVHEYRLPGHQKSIKRVTMPIMLYAGSLLGLAPSNSTVHTCTDLETVLEKVAFPTDVKEISCCRSMSRVKTAVCHLPRTLTLHKA